MLSTYYYIYIIVTYYVVNGITIIKYLHNGNYHNGGNGDYIATLCPIVNGVYCGATRYRIELRGAIYTLLVWALDMVTLRSYALRSRVHRLGLGVLRCVPHSPFPPKKICVFCYAWFTRMGIESGKPHRTGTPEEPAERQGSNLPQSPAVLVNQIDAIPIG